MQVRFLPPEGNWFVSARPGPVASATAAVGACRQQGHAAALAAACPACLPSKAVGRVGKGTFQKAVGRRLMVR
jgi:hypothetical protein